MDDLKAKHQGLLDRFKMFTRVNRENLSKDMARNSSLMFHVGEMKAQAEFAKDKAERKIELAEARADKRIRSKYNGKKKPSEQQIKGMVQLDAEVKAAKDEFIEAKYKHNVCWSAVSSIAEKGNQLTNLAYNYRKELEHGTRSRVKEERAKHKADGMIRKNKEGKED